MKLNYFTILLLVSFVLLAGCGEPANQDDGLTPNMKEIPSVNVKSYSNQISVEKPEAFFQGIEQTQEVEDKEGTELTIYNQNLALVKEIRNMFLKSGVNLVEYKDIASQIDSTSVLFRDLDFNNTFVLEQNYEYDIVSREKMLEKYLDKEITVHLIEGDKVSVITGRLLSADYGVLLETSDGIESISSISKISFPELPEGLLTKPTLIWKIWTENTGNRETETVYLTKGMTWRADYVAKVNESDTRMNFSGWTTVTNESGTSYPDTSLKLVAGDLHLVTPVSKYRYEYNYPMAAEAMDGAGGFVEEGLFEYHLYTLQRKTDIKNNESKQISLLESENVPVEKVFVYDGARQGEKVQVKLKFKNSEDQGLGIPLPKGIVRVYKEDSAGKLQFIGEDQIDHTKTEDEVRLYLGDAFDVSGNRTQTKSEKISWRRYRYSYEIVLENQKDEAIVVEVLERTGRFTQVTASSDPYDQKSSSEIEFLVTVPAKGEKTITYTFETNY